MPDPAASAFSSSGSARLPATPAEDTAVIHVSPCGHDGRDPHEALARPDAAARTSKRREPAPHSRPSASTNVQDRDTWGLPRDGEHWARFGTQVANRTAVKLRGEKKGKGRRARGADRPAPAEIAAPAPAEMAAPAVETAPAETAELAEIAEVMYSAALARTAAVEARERAAAERDEIANKRDRTSLERDEIANLRDRAAAERAPIGVMRLGPGTEGSPETADDEALERARLEAELQRAHLDALTGAFRREVGRLALRNEIERARRSDGKFMIAFVDVDGLKGVNDREGHAAGDRVLRTLAATMRANLRSYDPIVRFGGDEFICGISSIGQDEVQHRIGVIDQSLRHATGVGITAGLASLTSNETLEELTARADAALLQAKRSRGE